MKIGMDCASIIRYQKNQWLRTTEVGKGEKEGKNLTLMNIRNATQRKTLPSGSRCLWWRHQDSPSS